MENKLQNLKFRVYSEAHSKAIQEKLFQISNGITWLDGSNDISVDKIDFILYYNDAKKITTCETDDYFNRHENTLCTLDDLYKMQAEPNPKSELMTKVESLQKELDKVKEEISNLNK